MITNKQHHQAAHLAEPDANFPCPWPYSAIAAHQTSLPPQLVETSWRRSANATGNGVGMGKAR